MYCKQLPHGMHACSFPHMQKISLCTEQHTYEHTHTHTLYHTQHIPTYLTQTHRHAYTHTHTYTEASLHVRCFWVRRSYSATLTLILPRLHLQCCKYCWLPDYNYLEGFLLPIYFVLFSFLTITSSFLTRLLARRSSSSLWRAYDQTARFYVCQTFSD